MKAYAYAYVYFSLLSSILVSSSVYAACTPVPDCASLGYTSSNCPNGGVKCPFDTSKWHCDNPCDSEIYKYDCKSANETGGIGSACNGKFASCNCVSGYAWKNGKCQEKMNNYKFRCCNAVCGGGASYDDCVDYSSYDSDCSTLISTCYEQGGSIKLLACDSINFVYVGGYDYARYECQF